MQVSAERDIFEVFSEMTKSLTYGSKLQLHKLQDALNSHSNIVSRNVEPKIGLLNLYFRNANESLHEAKINDSKALRRKHRDMITTFLKLNATMDRFAKTYIRNCSNLVVGTEKKLIQFVREMVAEVTAIKTKRTLATVCLNKYGGIFTITIQPSLLKVDKCITDEVYSKSRKAINLQVKWNKVDELFLKYIQRMTYCILMRPLTMDKFEYCMNQDVSIGESLLFIHQLFLKLSQQFSGKKLWINK